ncbi:ketopantoate reductase family protein [Sinorhizobium fredii]|uniref:ketopantoate reductase family protein n=1 Tax=Rhizobium fredii TaxID=380 RepID=UPI001FCAFFEE|nr:2-dehydropantoate 2-reductase [Sinorhizobium fredii]
MRLACSGEDVSFIARGAHLQALRERGLRLLSPLGNVELAGVHATSDPSEAGTVDLVVFAVKLYDSEPAAAAIIPMVGPQTRVLTLQNGIDGIDMLTRVVPREQVVGGATYISSFLEEPGVIRQASGITQVFTGGSNDPVIEEFRSVCSRADGIDLTVVDDIDALLWKKFVTLAAFSGGTSLIRAGIGKIMADQESRKFMEQLRDEGMAVAATEGHPMPNGFVDEITDLWLRIPPETQASMAHDLAQGKRLELEWLSGRIHALGLKHGIPTLAHTAVYRALHPHAGGRTDVRGGG